MSYATNRITISFVLIYPALFRLIPWFPTFCVLRGRQQKDTSDYIKAVSSYIDKSDKGSKFKPGEAFDVLSNLKVYDEIAKKCISEPFSKINKLAEAGKKMEEGRDKFAELSIIEQMKTLLLLVDVLKTGRINTCNLKPVGGVESYHTERMSAILKNTKYSDIRIIDQSPTGLYEKKSDNLLEL